MIYKGARPAILFVLLFLSLRSRATADSGKLFDVVYHAGSGSLLLQGPWDRFEGLVQEGSLIGLASRKVDFALRSNPPKTQVLGSATYRMLVAIEGSGPGSSRLALYLPACSGIAAAYVNGQLLYARGRDPAAPPLLLFDIPKGEASILLQIGPATRGLEETSFLPAFAIFGEAEAVSRTSLLIGILAAFQDGFFLIVGLFVFLLFLFWKKNIDFLAFSVFLMTSGILYFFKGAALFAHVPLDANRLLLEMANVAATDLQYASLAFFLGSVYLDRISQGATLAFCAFPLAHAVATLIIPAAFVALAAVGTIYCAAFNLAALGYCAYRALRSDPKALWLTPAFACIAAGLALKCFGPESVWTAYFVEPASLGAFGAVAMLMLIKKVACSFKSTQTLTDYVATVSSAVNSFIPREFLDHLDKTDFIDLRLGDHAKKEMTIFFSDIRSFTALSEKLTVEENFAFINSYLSRVVPIIKENGGFVDKYIGDAIMALFHGPRGPDQAIRSAIAMQVKMVEYNGHRAKMGYRPISMGVGVHTGALMLGVVGVPDRMENTVISDAVNLSSRLQQIAKTFNIGLVISEQSFKELEDAGSYKYRFIGKVKVKGKAAPVSVFEIFDGLAPDLFERKMKANMFFEQGMLSYYQKDFGGAMYQFKRVLEIIPEDGAAGFYLDNCMNKATL